MSITVNTNMSSIIAQRSLYKATNKMNTALERLSTGLKINSSKEDAAGSAISTKLEYKMSSYNVAKDNAQMGQSMLDTANGTLSQINSMLQRIRDLSEQASNGTYGEDERKAMQAEIDGLTEEIYRIKNTTEFNGKKIFGEEENKGLSSVPTMSMSEVDIENITQTEWDSKYKGQIIGISNAKELQKVATLVNDKNINGSGTTFALTADIDLNELGDLDGNGSNWTAIGGGTVIGGDFCYFRGTFDGNGYTIQNLKINQNAKNFQGLFGRAEYATVKNLTMNNCKIESTMGYSGILAGTIRNSSIVENCHVLNSFASGTYAVGGITGDTGNLIIDNCSVVNSEFKGRSMIGAITGHIFSNGVSIINNTYTDAKIESLTSNQTGAFIGSIKDTATISITNCGYNKNTNGNLSRIGRNDKPEYDIKESTTNPFSPQEISIKTNLQVGINSDYNSVITVDTGFSLDNFKISVLSENSARNSLGKIDAIMSKITDKLTNIGATQNRLESVMEFQEIQRNALTSANSLIKDADIAKESANYVKNQILQNVTSTLLSTANQNPSIALQLI